MSLINTRIKQLNKARAENGQTVIYVMSRDQRVESNFALLAAQNQALDHKLPLVVIFNFYQELGQRSKNQFLWMTAGLKEVEQKLQKLNISFLVLAGSLEQNWPQISQLKPAALYFDFSPLRGSKQTKKKLANKAVFPCFTVDTHNIVPVWIASDKEEWAAWTLRKKITPLLKRYLKTPSEVKKHPITADSALAKRSAKTNWGRLTAQIKAPELNNYQPPFQSGRNAGLKQLDNFINKRLKNYSEQRNDPNLNSTSNLSPYLHFGQISSLETALLVKAYKKDETDKKLKQAKEDFLEELIVRKELSDNFCHYNPDYDSLQGAADWAKKTLKEHQDDRRSQLYSETDLEQAQTESQLWNAAQMEMMKSGKMSGYLRMFWAKKILEWSETPQLAIEKALYLNDKYELDGGDPNGYTGVMWSIAGIHDRAWQERKIFGKVRYMNANGAKRKFDTEQYITQWLD